jgi:hypothetical protein
MDTSLAIQHGLLYGVILSAVMAVLIIGSLRINNEMWLNDYPPDVRAKWGPMSPKAQKLKLWLGLPMFALVFGVLALQVVQLGQRSGGIFNFGSAALSLWVSLMLFNLVDLVLIDWLFMLILRPSFAILPGTEGLRGYSDYTFHFHGFLKGTVGITMAAPVLAAIAYGVYALVL